MWRYQKQLGRPDQGVRLRNQDIGQASYKDLFQGKETWKGVEAENWRVGAGKDIKREKKERGRKGEAGWDHVETERERRWRWGDLE